MTIATNGAEPYKSRLKELFPQMITPQQIGGRGWTAIRALPDLDASAKDQLREAVKTYMAGLDRQLDATPFGVPPSMGTWGGSGSVVDMATRMYFLHRTFPDLVSPEYTLRAVNYVLGTHPVSSTSYVAGVGTVSVNKTYGATRADNAYVPGAVIPGYIVIKPDFPECVDDFGFLRFEHEAVVAGSASWVVAGNAADAITKELKQSLVGRRMATPSLLEKEPCEFMEVAPYNIGASVGSMLAPRSQPVLRSFRRNEVATAAGMAGTFGNAGLLIFSLAIGGLVSTIRYMRKIPVECARRPAGVIRRVPSLRPRTCPAPGGLYIILVYLK